jgi:mannose-1-phosphate guanylyltransferase/mannose-6-phosphate isomerase
MMDAMQVRPVVLAGGSGTRLWPLSRTKLPKQLLAIAEPRSMLQATLARTAALAGAGVEALPPLLLAGEALRRLVRAQMAEAEAEAGVAMAGLMLEPEPRNTAPAIVLAALWAEARGEGAVPMLVMPSDHVIGLPGAFADAVAAGWAAAVGGRLVTFGIKPETPETGYGYIETGAAVMAGVFEVARFVEKPDLATAEAYVAGGRHLWNGGIFLMTPDAVLAEMAAHAPAVLAAVRAAHAGMRNEGDEFWPGATGFAATPSISIDHAVMERTARAAVVPVAMDWSDVGSWDALWQISERDGCGNACVGEAVLIDVADSLVRVEPGGASVAALGLSEMVIVSMADAVLVAPRGRVQEVKALAEAAAARAEAARAGAQEAWGRRETVQEGGGHREERLWLMPGRELAVRGPAQLVALAGGGLMGGPGGEQRLRAGEAAAVAAGGQAVLRNDGAGVWQLLMIGFGGAA